MHLCFETKYQPQIFPCEIRVVIHTNTNSIFSFVILQFIMKQLISNFTTRHITKISQDNIPKIETQTKTTCFVTRLYGKLDKTLYDKTRCILDKMSCNHQAIKTSTNDVTTSHMCHYNSTCCDLTALTIYAIYQQ